TRARNPPTKLNQFGADLADQRHDHLRRLQSRKAVLVQIVYQVLALQDTLHLGHNRIALHVACRMLAGKYQSVRSDCRRSDPRWKRPPERDLGWRHRRSAG